MNLYNIKAAVVNSCSKVIDRFRENKSGLQTKTEEPIKGKQRNNEDTKVQRKQMPTYIETNYLITIVIILSWYRTF